MAVSNTRNRRTYLNSQVLGLLDCSVPLKDSQGVYVSGLAHVEDKTNRSRPMPSVVALHVVRSAHKIFVAFYVLGLDVVRMDARIENRNLDLLVRILVFVAGLEDVDETVHAAKPILGRLRVRARNCKQVHNSRDREGNTFAPSLVHTEAPHPDVPTTSAEMPLASRPVQVCSRT